MDETEDQPEVAKRERKKPKEHKHVDLEAAGLQSFKMQKVPRSAITDAPYNPRQLNEAAKRKLKAGMKRHGLVAPLTWNKRTGHMVGGHQRLHQLDSLADSKDYELDVAMIDVDEAREKEINILLNNPQAQGEWDLGMLATILKTPELELLGTGFDQTDVFKMFGDAVLTQREDPLDEFANKIREARNAYNKIAATNASKDDSEFYCVVVFRHTDQLSNFLKKVGLPDNRYQSGEELARLCGLTPEDLTGEVTDKVA